MQLLAQAQNCLDPSCATEIFSVLKRQVFALPKIVRYRNKSGLQYLPKPNFFLTQAQLQTQIIHLCVFQNPENQNLPPDCKTVLSNGNVSSGEYTLQPSYAQLVKAYCNMSGDGGGWTVFQRREDGSVDFYRSWLDYENGFGNLSGEFWLGNRWLHLLTSLGPTELRIDFNGGQYVRYRSFSVGDATSKYRLMVSGYSTDGPDNLSPQNNMKFSTYDEDNDIHKTLNCAQRFSGAWWYKSCHESNLNGVYGLDSAEGIHWRVSLTPSKTFTEMKLRRV